MRFDRPIYHLGKVWGPACSSQTFLPSLCLPFHICLGPEQAQAMAVDATSGGEHPGSRSCASVDVAHQQNVFCFAHTVILKNGWNTNTDWEASYKNLAFRLDSQTGAGELPWRFSGWDSELPVQWVQVWSLVGELGSHTPCSMAKNEIDLFVYKSKNWWRRQRLPGAE